ncbi:hypothetical protein A9Q96_08435 [Rhodobacterales bacterium 52_120_T64]|nr:hypothetical protein A9Q96_08435 [Rhodobacterales bacterium 52_120_T64]
MKYAFIEEQRQTKLIKDAWEDSGKIYGYRKLHGDLCDLREISCPNRVARLASLAVIRAQIGYKRRPGSYGGKPSVVVDNTLDRQFDVDAPGRFWGIDTTYIRTCEGFSYLAVVIDLYSRRVVALSWFARAHHCQVIDGQCNSASQLIWCCRIADGCLAQKTCRQSLGAF